MNKADQFYFENEFLKSFEALGQQTSKKYANIIEQYSNIVIPFEKKRMTYNQSLIFENSSLEKDKMQMMGKIQQLRSQHQRLEYSLEKQLKKINDLERRLDDSEKINLYNASLIQSLRLTNQDLQEGLDQKMNDIKQNGQDNETLNEKYEVKTNDYNILLANYMKDKNIMAEKLNQMNQLQESLLEKQKNIKEQQFYLKKQWEQFQQKNKKEAPQQKKEYRIFGNKMSLQQKPCQQQIQVQTKKQKNMNSEILKIPMKKIYKHHLSEIYDLSFNYNGNLLATCGGDKQIKMFDVLNLRPTVTISSNSAQNIYISVALNYGGQRLLAGSTDKTVSIFHSESGKQLHSFLGHGDKVNSVAWSSSKQKCISGSQDKQLKIWQIEKACNIMSVSCGKIVKVVTSNSVEPVVYTGHSDGSVRVYSISQSTTPISQIKGIIDYAITSICLLSNRSQILVASAEGSCIHLLDLKMNKSVSKFDHKDFFNTSARAEISPSQNLVISGNCDGNIYYWDRYKLQFIKRVSGHDGAITALRYHSLTNALASADKEGSLIIWQ